MADETVFDRIIIDGGATVTGKETRPRPALVIKPAAGTPKVGLINCVVRHWHTRDTTAGVTGYDPASTGSILVLGGNLRLYHTTLYYSVGRNLADTGWGNVIDNRAGLLGGRNNIIWGFLDVSPAPVAVRDNFGVAASFGGNWTTIQGYSFSPLPNADPKLTAAGYLQHTLDGAGLLNPQLSSTVVIGQGTAVTGVLYDVRGQSRPAVSRDQGADEWGDADLDHLPDWWENYWFGGTTAQTRTGDPDGDGVNNLAEYHALSVPAALSNGNSPHARDSDGDGFTDDEELDNGSNPWDGLSMPPVQIQLISGASQSAETDAILDDQLVVKVSQMNRLSGIPVTFTSASGATFWNTATGKWLPSVTLTSNSTGTASVQVKAPASAGAAAMKAAVAGGAAVNFQASVSAPSEGGNSTVPPKNPEHFVVGWKFAGKQAQTMHFHWDPPWANAHVADVYVTGATPNSSIQVYSTLGDGQVHDGAPPPLAEVLAKGEFPEVLINSGPYPGVLNVGGGVRNSLPMDETWNHDPLTGIATGNAKGIYTYTFGWQNKVRLESNVELPAGYKVTVLPVVKTYDLGNFGRPQDPPPEMTCLEPITFEIPEGKKESLPVIVPLQDVAVGKRVLVDAVCIGVKKAWSDQLPNVIVNGLPNKSAGTAGFDGFGTGWTEKPYVFMGVRADGKAYARLALNHPIESDMRDSVAFRFGKLTADRALAEAGSSTVSESGTEVSVVLDSPVTDVADYVIVAGIDANKDGVLAPGEPQFIPKCDNKLPSSLGGKITNQPFLFKIVTKPKYQDSVTTIKGVAAALSLNGWFNSGFRNAGDLLNSFAEGGDPGFDGPAVSQDTVDRIGRIGSDGTGGKPRGLSHPVGITFVPQSNPGSTIQVTYPSSSDFSEKFLKSATFWNKLRDFLEAKKEEVRQKFRDDAESLNPTNTFYWNDFTNELSFDKVQDTEMFLAMGHARFRCSIEVVVHRWELRIQSLKVTGDASDLYDFEFGQDIPPSTYVSQAAQIQAGYNTCGSGGRVIVTKLNFMDGLVPFAAGHPFHYSD